MGKDSMNYSYKFIAIHNHPLFPGQQQVKRSRLVMAESLGRPLLRTELVHHKNENTMDDRKRNLKIVSRGKHNTYHKKGKIFTAEHKHNLSLAGKGRVFTAKHKQNLSVARKGQPSNRKGKHLSVETKKKISFARRNYWLQRKFSGV